MAKRRAGAKFGLLGSGLLGSGLLGLGLLALAGCAGSPGDVGITGPFPEGVTPVTLTRAAPRGESADDTPGVLTGSDSTSGASVSRLTAASRTASPVTARRYYGYDH